MTAEAQRKAELERTAREAAEREAKLRAELLNAQGKTEQERIAREAAQREAKLQVEKERIAREAAQREARQQAEQERIAREAAEREAKLQAELRAAQVKLQQEEAAKKQAAQAELQQAEAAKKQAALQAAATAAVPQKAASSAGAGPGRYNGTYRGQLCTKKDTGGESGPFCRQVKIKVKQGMISGSWFSPASGKNAHLKGTIAPEGAVKVVIEAFDGKGRPMSCTLTGTGSDDTITASGTWRPRGIPVTVVWTREP